MLSLLRSKAREVIKAVLGMLKVTSYQCAGPECSAFVYNQL